MSEQQMAELYERIVREKKKGKLVWPFLRGWNAALDFVVKQMRAVCDEKDDDRAA